MGKDWALAMTVTKERVLSYALTDRGEAMSCLREESPNVLFAWKERVNRVIKAKIQEVGGLKLGIRGGVKKIGEEY